MSASFDPSLLVIMRILVALTVLSFLVLAALIVVRVVRRRMRRRWHHAGEERGT